MSASVVVLPHPPLLLRELSGAVDVGAELREACLDALRPALAGGPAAVVVVGGSEESRSWDPGTPVDVRRFGTTGPRTGPGLPLPLEVARRLLDEAGWSGPTELRTLAWDAEDPEVEALAGELRGRVGVVLLLMGEGSACRGERAPGFLDERAFPLDDVLADSLALGDCSSLRTLDGQLCRELMVSGRDVLRLLGWLAEAPAEASLDYRDDPFGVSYLVASWQLPE